MAITISQSLRSVNAYPIPETVLQDIAASRELNLDREADVAVRETANYQLARADVFEWLADAPDVTQAGISFKFAESERKEFRGKAATIYSDCGVAKSSSFNLGFKGELF